MDWGKAEKCAVVWPAHILEIMDIMSSRLKRKRTIQIVISAKFRSQYPWQYAPLLVPIGNSHRYISLSRHFKNMLQASNSNSRVKFCRKRYSLLVSTFNILSLRRCIQLNMRQSLFSVFIYMSHFHWNWGLYLLVQLTPVKRNCQKWNI